MTIYIENLNKTYVLKEKKTKSISLKNIFTPKYEEKKALNNLSLEIGRGESLAFVGPNGAGKSTTIKLLTGLLYPSSGKVLVNDYVPWQDRKKLSYSIGLVFGQKSQLWYHLPAKDAFELLSTIYGLNYREYLSWYKNLVKIFDIENLLHIPVRKLSLGQRMKCEIVASLIHKPNIIFLDEPTIGLDVVSKQITRDLIKNINDMGTTVFLTSHDTSDMESICSRIVVMNDGMKMYDGQINELKGLLDYKIIELNLGIKNVDLSSEGLNIIERKPYYVKLEMNQYSNDFNQIINSLLTKYPINDISINSPSMDFIISQLYRDFSMNIQVKENKSLHM